MANIFDLFKKIESKGSAEPISAIIVGLGNPGREYEKNRHNVGFISIDYIADKLGVKIDRAKFHARVAEATLGTKRVLLMKPETFMNNSGVAVGEAAAFYKIAPESIIVISDDISLEPGTIRLRVRRKGSAGGHNGLKSIIAHIASEEFPRVKIGVGKKPHPDYDLADWVLGNMGKEDNDKFLARLSDIYESVKMIALGDIDGAMCKYSK